MLINILVVLGLIRVLLPFVKNLTYTMVIL